MTRILLPAWIVVSLLLFLYSYTQVSLSLALNKLPFLYTIQQGFQYIGYFNRPLSVLLYCALLGLLFTLYIVTLSAIQKKKLTVQRVWIIIGCVIVILSASYNAFSHDIFNYIFDAKIVTEYQENPYMRKALDYPNDPMLSFMQWTHRTYPYGPVWLVITLPFSYIGMQYFLPTFYLFKILAAGAYLGTVWGIYTIVSIKKKEYALFSAALFALNPLMMIEFLVSAHNDIVMLLLGIVAVYLLLQQKRVFGGLVYVLSVGVKYATGFLAPMMMILFFRPKYFERAVVIGVLSMIGAVIAASIKSGNFQPWYFSYVFVIASLLSYQKYIRIPVIVFSVFACLHYIPYLYTGTWDPPIPSILFAGLVIATICSIVTSGYYLLMYFGKRSKV